MSTTKFITFTLRNIETYLNKSGEEKKKPVGMPKWQEITKENFEEYNKKSHKAVAVICGEISGITVFDFDDKAVYLKICEDCPELKNYYTVETKNGFHIYCDYDASVGTTTNGLINYDKIDIRNDNSIVFAPPTKYKLINGQFAEYKFVGGEILPVPEILIKNLKQNQVSKKVEAEAEPQPQPQPQPQLTEILVNLTEDAKFIDSCIERGLLSHMSNSYDDWRNVGFAIKSSLKGEDGFNLFNKFSKINVQKYDEDYTTKFWATIKDNNKKPITIGSLKKWVKLADPEKYKEINNKLNPKLTKKDLRTQQKNSQADAERERNNQREQAKEQFKLPSGKTVDFKASFMDGVLTDLEATEKIFSLYPHWVFCLEEMYVFDNTTGMWSNSKTAYLNVIKQHSDFIHIMILDDDTGNWEKHQFRSYGNFLSSMEKIIPLMKTMNMNNNKITLKSSISE